MEHGHEAPKSHDGLLVSSVKWMEKKGKQLFMAVGFGILAATTAPALLCVATGLAMPAYLATLTGYAVAAEVARGSGAGEAGHGADHVAHGAHGGH